MLIRLSSRQRATKMTRVVTLAPVKCCGGEGSKLAEENREKFNDFNFVTKSQIFSFVQPPLRAAALDIVLQADQSISVCRVTNTWLAAVGTFEADMICHNSPLPINQKDKKTRQTKRGKLLPA